MPTPKKVMPEYQNKEYAKQIFEQWIRETVDSWLHEYGAWDDKLEDGLNEFNEEDWEYIKNNLKFDVTIKCEDEK